MILGVDGRPLFPLKTARFDIRLLRQMDVPDVFGLYSNQHVARHLLKLPFPFTLEAAQQFVSEAQEALTARPPTAYTLAVIRRDAEIFVGIQVITIHAHNTFLNDREREKWAGIGILGYSVVHAHWGQGIATEAAYRMIAFAFEDLRLNRLQASTVQENVASRRVLESLGFTLEETGVSETPRYGGPQRLVDRYVLLGSKRPRL